MSISIAFFLMEAQHGLFPEVASVQPLPRVARCAAATQRSGVERYLKKDRIFSQQQCTCQVAQVATCGGTFHKRAAAAIILPVLWQRFWPSLPVNRGRRNQDSANRWQCVLDVSVGHATMRKPSDTSSQNSSNRT